MTASTQRCSDVVARRYPVPDGTTCVHYGLDSLHHNAASSGSADISSDLDSSADSRLPPRLPLSLRFSRTVPGNDVGRRATKGRQSVEPRSPAIATSITCCLMLISRAMCICACMGVYVENELRDAATVGSSVQPVRRASRVRSTATASGQGETTGVESGSLLVLRVSVLARLAAPREHPRSLPPATLRLASGRPF